MQRVTITLDDGLIEEIDRFMSTRQYATRSEAVRDLLRAGLAESSEGAAGPAADGDRACVAALVYVFDHDRRDLANRLTHAHHDHHDMSLATTHVHLNSDQCLEVALLRGKAGEIRHFADHLTAERGVRHGRLVVVPLDEAEASAPAQHHHD
ncbi:nickel-responsive transcriptional regulator NikR [Zavarzinia compransoris]|uniref:nickel-responsive transcriptional regulator NikR n=1 Tax=Zavarzinia marina TaxID=2911065 RepID=UPI001F2B6D16|nr:nickel-responsive transcriptional regulator NikR [Zavarzinia marina]MCF4165089.1 nickel-responsive transcriptional regulator NikR [Zavarzinia marina]